MILQTSLREKEACISMGQEYFFFYTEANIVCIVILGLLLFHTRKYTTRTEKQIWYDRTIIAHIFYFTSDIGWAGVLSGQLPRTRFLVIAFNLINFVLLSLISYSWFMYMASSVGLKFRNYRHVRLLCLLPMALFTLSIIIAYIAAPYFWISEDNELSIWYYPMMIAAPIIYLVSAFFFSMIKARKSESRQTAKQFRLIGIYPMGVLAFGLIQTIFLDAPLFCFGCIIMMLFFFIQAMQTMVSVDSLTRLNNRGQINRYMEQNRYRENVDTYAIMLDINRFKEINDTWGHAEGDKALILVADVLKQAMGRTGASAFLGRYGGDEFALFLQCTDERNVLPDQLLAAVRTLLEEKQREEHLPYTLAVSADSDKLRGPEDTLEACLKRADEKLYQNKRAANIGR